MKYASPHQNMSMTLLREGSLINVKFVGGVFETEDPLIIAALEKHPAYGRQIHPVGVPTREVKINPAQSEIPGEAKPAPERKGSKKKVSKAQESKAIEEFMK